MSQSVLSEALGISFQQVQKYEKATNRIGAGRLQEIATALGTTIGYFFEEQEDPKDHRPIVDKEVIFDRQSDHLLRAFAAIDDSHLRRAIVILTRAAARYQRIARQ
jgi:transcriptional regulator with XRE-family HTH domain